MINYFHPFQQLKSFTRLKLLAWKIIGPTRVMISWLRIAMLDTNCVHHHGFQNWTEPGGWTMKTGNRDENRFFKPKEPAFLLISWTVKTGVGPQEPVRTVRSNPLANFFFLIKKQLNTILFYLIKLSISYKE